MTDEITSDLSKLRRSCNESLDRLRALKDDFERWGLRSLHDEHVSNALLLAEVVDELTEIKELMPWRDHQS